MNYKITAHKIGLIKEPLRTFQWLVQTQKVLLNYLNNLDEKKSFYTPNYLYKHVTYSKAKPNKDLLKFSDVVGQKMVGRLYSSKSINCISREIRYTLFFGEYVDYDIVNCHPSICLNYGETEGLGLKGDLRKYVEDREATLKKIKEELNIHYLKNPSAKSKEGSVKHQILIIQNRTWDKYDTGSKTLNELDDEFTIVREHLWGRYLNNEFIEYGAKVEARETLQKKMTSLQSLFFQSKETQHLFALKSFLTEKHKFHIDNKESIKGFKDLIIHTDKEVNISATHGLFMIPFFDGFYIRALDDEFMSKLDFYVDIFNREYKKKHRVVFAKKEIEPEYSYLTSCPDKHKNFSSITGFLRKTNRIGLLRKYMEKLPQVDDCLSKLKGFDISSDTYCEDVKQVNNEIKTHLIHSFLTSGEYFNSVEEVSKHVSQILSIKNPKLKDLPSICEKYSKYDLDSSFFK